MPTLALCVTDQAPVGCEFPTLTSFQPLTGEGEAHSGEKVRAGSQEVQ